MGNTAPAPAAAPATVLTEAAPEQVRNQSLLVS
jgi:hypothetical protein